MNKTAWPEFLYRKSGQKSKAHYWNGQDTACCMWSTGGMDHDREWVVSKTADGHPICKLCKDRPEVGDYPQQPLSQPPICFLDVPYEDKDEARSLGARFHPLRRLWYVPSGIPRSRFRWLDATPQKGEPQFTVPAQARAFDLGHIWTGTDTACELSAFGENYKGWVIVRSLGTRQLCPMCKRMKPDAAQPKPQVSDEPTAPPAPADLPKNWMPTQGGLHCLRDQAQVRLPFPTPVNDPHE